MTPWERAVPSFALGKNKEKKKKKKKKKWCGLPNGGGMVASGPSAPPMTVTLSAGQAQFLMASAGRLLLPRVTA